MAGYYGYSMSNNAVEAYRRRCMPLSKWTRSAIFEALEDDYFIEQLDAPEKFDISVFENWNAAELKTLLYKSEWHHTSGAYHKTDFYELDIVIVEEYLAGKQKPVIKAQKRAPLKEDEGFWHGKCKCTEYHPASRYNKYKVWYEDFENCKRKGNWIILSDGSKKRFENCIDLAHTKYKRRHKNH